MLNAYRRHTASCPHRHKGRRYIGCRCPVWVDGILAGREIRKSLDTRDWQIALRKIAGLETPEAAFRVVRVDVAIQAFLRAGKELAPSTLRKYANVLRHFGGFAERYGAHVLPELTVELIDAYREQRAIGKMTASKELETLRRFCGFCLERHWLTENAARRVRQARNLRPADVAPYTATEVARITMAAGQIGRNDYERRRALAMVLLMRATGLRISDVAMLRRDRVLPDGRIHLRAAKTGGEVYLPLSAAALEALSALPLPRHAEPWCPWWFWNGITSPRAVVGIAERAMAAVFRLSGVAGAKSHRFRHTLATELLERGGSMQEVADVLGISVKVAERHYAKWSAGRQERIDRLMAKVHQGDILIRGRGDVI